MKRHAKKLAILGSAPSKADAPFDDLSYDIWSISGAAYSESLGKVKAETKIVDGIIQNDWNCIHRLTVLFEMHKRPEHVDKLEKLQSMSIPIIMQRKYPDIPMSEPYPVDEIAQAVGEDFTSSIAYMLAYGIYLKYEEIKIYGVTMLHKDEYASQRPSVMWYLGIAKERGIKVWACPESRLTGRRNRYGYDDQDKFSGYLTTRERLIDEDIAQQKANIEKGQRQLAVLEGAKKACMGIVSDIGAGVI